MIAPPILTRDQAAPFLAPAIDPALWTALIPAAGRGTRLDWHLPKILYPVAGRPILAWLLDLLAPRCSGFVFVIAPGSAIESVEPELNRLIPGRFRIAIQHEPLGMADAIACGLPAVGTPNTLIVWGDQVALQPASLDLSIRLHQGPAAPAATLPTLIRANPYIHFERDHSGRILRVLQAREGDAMPESGESDSGLFLFRTDVLRDSLATLIASPDARGRQTHELNFLPIFPMLDNIVSARIMTEEESIGVNSRADAEHLERRWSAQARP
jgi:bifunctional UDP-N-acetylglucosamine pyrophosphorylase / glucosamine-1-phosphate N-acetyltransferase